MPVRLPGLGISGLLRAILVWNLLLSFIFVAFPFPFFSWGWAVAVVCVWLISSSNIRWSFVSLNMFPSGLSCWTLLVRCKVWGVPPSFFRCGCSSVSIACCRAWTVATSGRCWILWCWPLFCLLFALLVVVLSRVSLWLMHLGPSCRLCGVLPPASPRLS